MRPRWRNSDLTAQGGHHHGRHRIRLYRPIGQTQGGRAFPDRCRAIHRRRHDAESDAGLFPALAARARENPRHRHVEGEKGTRRRRNLHRRRPGRRERPAVRLVDHERGRHADEGAAASRAGEGQGALRRRSRRDRHRRNARSSEGRRRADRRRLRVSTRSNPARRRFTTRRRATSATRGRSATRPPSTRHSRKPRT